MKRWARNKNKIYREKSESSLLPTPMCSCNWSGELWGWRSAYLKMNAEHGIFSVFQSRAYGPVSQWIYVVCRARHRNHKQPSVTWWWCGGCETARACNSIDIWVLVRLLSIFYRCAVRTHTACAANVALFYVTFTLMELVECAFRFSAEGGARKNGPPARITIISSRKYDRVIRVCVIAIIQSYVSVATSHM